MKTLLSQEALVAAYWRRLARSIDAGDGKQKKPLSLELEAHSGLRKHFTAFQRKVKLAIPRRRASALQLRNGDH